MPHFETTINGLIFHSQILDGGKFVINTMPSELRTQPQSRRTFSELLVNAIFKVHPFDLNKVHWVEDFNDSDHMDLLYLCQYGKTIHITERILVEREHVYFPN